MHRLFNYVRPKGWGVVGVGVGLNPIQSSSTLFKVMHRTCSGDLANFLHSSTAASSLSFLRPLRMTVAPLCANCLAVAAPIPLVEPVTKVH